MEAMTTTLPPSIPPRVVEHESAPRARGDRWQLPDHTLRGAVAGAEAAIGSWLVVVALTVAGYVATAAAPELGTATWLDAARVGSAIWLLGHGGGLQLDGAAVSMVPLGVTLLGLAGVATSVRRARLLGWWPPAVVIGVYTLLAGGFLAFAGTAGSWRGVVGAALVAVAGCLVAQRGRYPAELTRLLARLPAEVRAGLTGAVGAIVLLLALGLAALALALVLGFSRVMQVHDSLVPDTASSVVMVVAQLLLLPTLIVWGTAFVTGPGFAVGAGTAFAPTGIEAGPLPVVPLLGALPEPGSAAGSLGLIVLAGVGVGAAVGAWLRRRPLPLLPALVAVLTTGITTAVALAALAWLSSGAVGPGRMAVVGPDPLATGLAVGWQITLGVALVVLPTHPRTWQAARDGWSALRTWWADVRS